MVLEVAVLYVRPGKEVDFESDFKIAGQYISSVPGYINHSLQKMPGAKREIFITGGVGEFGGAYHRL